MDREDTACEYVLRLKMSAYSRGQLGMRDGAFKCGVKFSINF